MAANPQQLCEDTVGGLLGDRSEWAPWDALMIAEWCRAHFPPEDIAYAVRMQRQMRKLLVAIKKRMAEPGHGIDADRIERAKRQVREGMLAVDALDVLANDLEEEDRRKTLPLPLPLKGALLEYETPLQAGYDEELARQESDDVIALLRGVHALLTVMRALDLTHELGDAMRTEALTNLYAGRSLVDVLGDVLKAPLRATPGSKALAGSKFKR